MKFEFRSRIVKVGINPCVKVPLRITQNMVAVKGYIPVKGKIKNHLFHQTLVSVKEGAYRLYVNGSMLKGSRSVVGESVTFQIEQTTRVKRKTHAIHPALKRALIDHHVQSEFAKVIPSRRKEIIRYLNGLKTRETLDRNVEKIIQALKTLGRLNSRWY